MRTLRLALVGAVIVVLLGSAVVAQEEEAPQTPAWVTGTVVGMEFVSQARETFTDGRVRAIEETWRSQQSVSDPRLSGPAVFVNTADSLTIDDESMLFVGTVAIENEGGSWSGRHVGLSGPRQLEWVHDMQVELVGQGGYEGLQALLFYRGTGFGFDTFEGLVFEGGLPPMPE